MNSLKPARRDIKDARRANTFRRRIEITGLDINSVQSWTMKVVPAGSTVPVIVFSTVEGGITVDGLYLVLERTAEQMKHPAATYKYDLVMTLLNGEVHTLMEGDFVISNSISV